MEKKNPDQPQDSDPREKPAAGKEDTHKVPVVVAPMCDNSVASLYSGRYDYTLPFWADTPSDWGGRDQ